MSVNIKRARQTSSALGDRGLAADTPKNKKARHAGNGGERTRSGMVGGIGGPNEQSDMPRPLKVKMFMDAKPSIIEEQINEWLDYLGSATIIKTETVVTAIAEKPGDGTYPCIVVTVWYEPPETN